jgi:SP family arabinose:H+ symporter-like MFS transporter
MNVSLGAI